MFRATRTALGILGLLFALGGISASVPARVTSASPPAVLVPSMPSAAAYSTKVSVEPLHQAGKVRFQVLATELATGRIVAIADLTAEPGVPVKADAEDPETKARMVFEARVENRFVMYSFVMQRAGEIMARHEGQVEIR